MPAFFRGHDDKKPESSATHAPPCRRRTTRRRRIHPRRTIMLSRRTLVGSLLALPVLPSPLAMAEDSEGALRRGLADLESRYGGRLGVAVLDTAAGQPVAQRGD